MGSTCEAGCRAIVRIQFDQALADGTLAKLDRPLHIFTGLQFEEIKPWKATCIWSAIARSPCWRRFPDAKYWGSSRGVSQLHAHLGEYPAAVDCQLYPPAR